jgi:hypothetical protein
LVELANGGDVYQIGRGRFLVAPIDGALLETLIATAVAGEDAEVERRR